MNIRNKHVISMILFIAVISVSFCNVQPASAATMNIQQSSYYNTTSFSLNDQIQNIIDSAKDGDTLTFMGKYYGNLSLIIKKSLNLITNVNTTVTGDTSGQPVFFVTGSGSRWTNITGFNIKSTNEAISVKNTSNVTVSKNTVTSTKGTGIKVSGSTGVTVKKNTVSSSQTGVSVRNSQNSTIKNNNVKNSAINGVEIENSHDIKVSNNNISFSNKHGTSIANSQNIDLEGNDIEHVQNNGVNLIYTDSVILNNNTISNNGVHGVYLGINVKNTQIAYNIITNNLKYGIELDGSGSTTNITNTDITNNTISGNKIGIDVNSGTDNLNIIQNAITKNKGNDEDSGIGINFGWGYKESTTLSVYYNVITDNERREVCASDYSKKTSIGYNWYGSDDPRQVRVCPYVSSEYVNWMTTESNGKFTTIFYGADGQVATLLPNFDIIYQLNNGKKVRVTVKNGVATVTFPSSEYKLTGNLLTIQTTSQKKQMSLDDEEVKEILKYLNQNNGNNGNGNNGNGNNGNGDNGNGNGGNNSNGNGNNGNGNGSSGTGGNNGNGNSNNGNTNTPGNNGQINNGNSGGNTAQSSSTSSSSYSGSPKLERTSAQIDGAAEEAQSTSSQDQASDQTKTAQEILLDNVNPNLWSIVALVLLIATIVVVYYRKEIELMYRK
ncbi:parallel beta-helix repeat [Methanobacterium lacus]|uniref:Parallel beta-helix repeat n=1 Tax=Methanobacterium lacus (strain AL-21) TaxID=877455 RepID=F0T774_METLA|nr:right-handed parallel beta-helix repeat-containing protein [Methanobacterium lacus]ADZ10708.1 parallel beta-helix repeat [Methanobacterium lacus]